MLEFYTLTHSDSLEQHQYIANSLTSATRFVVLRKRVEKLPHHFTKEISDQGLIMAQQVKLAELVYLSAAGNPRFDIASMKSTLNGKSLGIFVKCHFSDPAAKTTIKPVAVETKRQLTLRKSHIDHNSAILVVCAFQKLHSAWFSKAQEHTNTNKRTWNKAKNQHMADGKDKVETRMRVRILIMRTNAWSKKIHLTIHWFLIELHYETCILIF